ncbi:LamG-like jellyroll fold domain-containing protein [Lacinutrix sp. WUR7]|uniref:LamG-like jellyroll fold domain-containing protein n=1 Tax=Lacinutrix sp. WUR7 TaxID=2653681 RepID=UPI00193E73FA|nr:LamG-like jellyroll fold domain-containing protein [Lacinutrix sp. WUR7]
MKKNLLFFSLFTTIFINSYNGFSTNVKNLFLDTTSTSAYNNTSLNTEAALFSDYQADDLSNSIFRSITSCPGSTVSANVDPGVCSAVVTFALPTTDISGGSMVLITSLGDGDTFPVGITTVTYVERDALNMPTGNSCNFDVIVTDNEDPVTPTLSPVTVDCNGTLTAPTTTDVCAGNITGSTTDTLSFSEGGNTTINWIFDDGNGNTISVPQTYNYDDTTDPVTPTLASVTVDCNGTLTAPTTTDVCAGSITGTTTDTLSFVEGGSTIINWTFDDGNGNTISVPQTYNYDDTTNPVAPTLAAVTVDCNGTLTAPTTTDACAGSITGTTADTLSFVEGGSTIINWTFDDGNGNTISVPQTYNYDDTTNPVAPTLAPVTVDCNGTLTAPTTTDVCAGLITGTTSDTLSFVEGGSTIINWTFDDGNGNSISVPQTYNYDDTTNPVAPTLSAVTVDCNGTLTAPTTTDACAGSITGTTTDTLSFVEGGSTIINWTFDDGNGNTISVPQTYNYDDTTNPVAPTLAAVTVDCNGTLTAPTTTDVCAGSITGTTSDTLSFVEGGSTTINWIFDDGNGNTISVPQTYNYDDTTNPVAPTLSAVTVDCNGTLTAPTTTDACAGSITGTTSDTLSFVEGGSTTINWTFDDGNGNTISVPQTYNYDDTTNPVAPTLSAVTVDCNGTLTAPTTTDVCAGSITGTTSDTLSFVEGGSTTINWTFDDGNGNTISVPQTYNYDDTTNPVAPTLAAVTVDCNGTLTAPTTTDVCAGLITGTTSDTLSFVEGGSTIINWTFDDGNGNSISVPQTYNYDDTTNPVAPTLAAVTVDCNGTLTAPTTTDVCAGLITGTTSDTLSFVEGGSTTINWIFDDGNGNTISVPQTYNYDDTTNPVAPTLSAVTVDCNGTLTAPTTTDACAGSITGTTSDTLSFVEGGSTTINWTFDDGNGNTISVPQTYNYDDTTNPVAPTLSAVTVDCNGTLTAPTTTDVCAGSITGTTSDTLSFVEGGSTTINWTFDDGNGNTISVPQTYNYDDTTNPVTPTLASVTVDCNGTLTAPTTTDVCAGSITGTTSDTLSFVEGGSTTINWTFDDGNGNTISVPQTYNYDDTTNPVTPTLASVTVDCNGTLTAPTTTDVCAGSITGTTSDTLSFVEGGSTIINWTFDDGNGNTISVPQTYNYDDTTNPVAPTLAAVTVDCNGTLTAPTTTDVCAGSITGTTSDTLSFVEGGSTTINWIFDDGNGNTISVPQTYNYDDTTNPVTPTLASVTVDCNGTLTAPTTTDVCAGSITGTTSDTLSFVEGGSTIINWTFDDGNGNTISVPQTYNYDDTTNPVAPTLAAVTVDCNGTLTAPTTTDVCAGSITGTTSDTLSFVEGGSTTINWIFDDGNGNTISVPQTYNYDDTTNPVIPTLTAVNDQCSVTLTPPTTTDNCAGTITGTTSATFPITTQGTTIVTWTFNDGNGNTVTQTQNVIITDTTPPIAICQNITVTLDVTGSVTVLATDIDNGSTDNCGIQSISLDNTLFDCSDLGSNTVILTVRDLSGNISTCTATVTVIDPAASASVSILSDDANNEICNGENLTFTGTPFDGGATPIYEWFINGTSFGTNSPTFTPFTTLPVGTNTIYVEMQSSLSACILPKPSNTISVIVHPSPTTTAPTQICMGNSGTLTPNTGGTWTSSNTGIATVTNAGVITPVAPGNVTFAFQDNTTICSSTTNNVVINALPIASAPTTICVNEINSASPATGGTWTSSNSSVATITNTGSITGVTPGFVTFTFNDANGCSATTNSMEVLDIPVINSVTVSEDPVCAGDPSILDVNVLGAGTLNETLVNYNFNSGGNYAALNGQEAPGITSAVTEGFNMPFRTGNGRVTGGNAFSNNGTAGNALRQDDARFSDNTGYWVFTINGANLSNYENLRVYFQTRRTNTRGDDKYVDVYYRINSTNIADFVYLDDVFLNNNNSGTQWQEALMALPAAANNVNRIDIALQVSDGYYFGFSNNGPDVLVDNFQVEGATASTTFEYTWTANTGANAGLPATASTASTTNNNITVNPTITTDYTVTVTNSDGCPETETVTVNVFPSPEIIIQAEYCPTDDPSTSQDESQMVQLVATSNQPITSWTWLTDPVQYGNTIYVDTAGEYQVLGVTANGCSESAIQNVASELVTNGDFSLGNIGFTNGYTYVEDVAGNNELQPQNTYSITTNGQNVHNNFWGADHTTGSGNFMAVNGAGSSLIVWEQANVPVLPNTTYYFSAYGMSLNYQWRTSRRARLTFNINGTNVGTTPTLPNRPDNNNPGSDNWTRFYGTYTTGPTQTSVDLEIRNLNNSASGNDFGLDDISFATLSTFIRLTTPVGTDNQIVCQNAPITDITYDIGGGLTPPSISGLPAGLTTTFDGLEFIITGTPTQVGTFNYTLQTTSSCDVKTATGIITVNEAPVVAINTLPQTVCQSNASILLEAGLTPGTTVGNVGSGWSTSGTGTFDDIYNLAPTYTFGIGETGTVTLSFTSNIPTGPCLEATDSIDIEITPFIIAAAGPDQLTTSCSDTTVTLAANNTTGNWTATPNTGYFSDPTAYNASFTGESGETYILTWTVTNVSPCSDTTDTVEITIPNCANNLVFDGTDDNISFADNYGLDTGSFSIEAWIKPNTVSGTQTIISKRNGNNLNSGYDLSLIGNRLYFRWNNSEIFATQTMNNTKWYHVAVTYDGANYTMYIDGFVIRAATAGASPLVNTNKALIGAMDRTNNSATNFFGGGIDEVRIWNSAISQTQIREMMNQEIEANGTDVSGVVVPLNISGGLQWNSLIGYYQMKSGSQASVSGGMIQDISTANPIAGNLNKMTTDQLETAPIPYVSIAGTDWDLSTTWSSPSVQQIPNSKLNSINGFEQTWNIVQTETNVITNRPATVLSKTVLLGLIVENNTLSIANDQPLIVNKYLKINGILDLQGESQLLQPIGSIVDYTGNGNLHRDQQGTTNLYNYNYWSSPVSSDGNTYQIGSVLYDGTSPVNWTPAHDANGGSPVTMSSRWLYLFENYAYDSYINWHRIDQTYAINVGLGFTMKGSGNSTAYQNYTFVGQPNNGDITHVISASIDPVIGNESLIGNPYPSAIDANAVIASNQTTLLDGTIRYWEHAPSNNSHVTAAYEGGYAYYNLLGGGVAAVSPPEINGVGNATTLPKRFIPVGQGFMVTAKPAGGTFEFNNSQRVFIKETSGNSVFMRTENRDQQSDDHGNENQLIRIDFKSPENAVRHLLLGFTPNNEASEGVDYGYDALNTDYFASDMSFIIEGEKYVIQGVGAFNDENMYPVTIDLGTTGNIQITLAELENFNEDIDVFVYDALLETYTRINDTHYQITLDPGSHSDRYFISFKDGSALNTPDEQFSNVVINYLTATSEIYINVPTSVDIKQVYLVNLLGQTVKSWNGTNAPLSHECRLPVKKISEGTYIIKVRTSDNALINKKIVVKQ